MGRRAVDYSAWREAQVMAEELEAEERRLLRLRMEARPMNPKGKSVCTWDQVRSVLSKIEWKTAREVSVAMRLGRKVAHSPSAVRDVLVVNAEYLERRERTDVGRGGGRRPFEYRLASVVRKMQEFLAPDPEIPIDEVQGLRSLPAQGPGCERPETQSPADDAGDPPDLAQSYPATDDRILALDWMMAALDLESVEHKIRVLERLLETARDRRTEILERIVEGKPAS